jgi:hypothetical protein
MRFHYNVISWLRPISINSPRFRCELPTDQSREAERRMGRSLCLLAERGCEGRRENNVRFMRFHPLLRIFLKHNYRINRGIKKSSFGPLANYTDRATAACWRSSANFLRIEGVAWSAQRIPPVVSLGFLDRSRYCFFQVAPQLCSRGWVDPVPDPLLIRKFWSAGIQTQDLWICSQKLWPPDHRGGHRWTPVLIKSNVASFKVTMVHEVFTLNILTTMGSLGPIYTNEQILCLLYVKIS